MAADSPARSVPFFNYQQAFTMHEEEYVRIFRRVMRRGAFIMQRSRSTAMVAIRSAPAATLKGSRSLDCRRFTHGITDPTTRIW